MPLFHRQCYADRLMHAGEVVIHKGECHGGGVGFHLFGEGTSPAGAWTSARVSFPCQPSRLRTTFGRPPQVPLAYRLSVPPWGHLQGRRVGVRSYLSRLPDLAHLNGAQMAGKGPPPAIAACSRSRSYITVRGWPSMAVPRDCPHHGNLPRNLRIRLRAKPRGFTPTFTTVPECLALANQTAWALLDERETWHCDEHAPAAEGFDDLERSQRLAGSPNATRSSRAGRRCQRSAEASDV
jgi:hypothetical protein